MQCEMCNVKAKVDFKAKEAENKIYTQTFAREDTEEGSTLYQFFLFLF